MAAPGRRRRRHEDNGDLVMKYLLLTCASFVTAVIICGALWVGGVVGA
jgi:hypothetical protein